jgi:hypothetical protein
MTGDKVKLKKPVPVPMKIGGTWDKPEVTGVDVGDLVKAVVSALGGKAVEDAVSNITKDGGDKAKDKAADAVGDLLGGDDKDKKKDKGKKKDKKKDAADKAKDAAKGLLGK